jgi:hypothetical protein
MNYNGVFLGRVNIFTEINFLNGCSVNIHEKIEIQEHAGSLGYYNMTLDPKRKGKFTIHLFLGATLIRRHNG